MARRGENIYKRKDGRWEARYPKNYSAKGNVIYGSVYGQTYNEAKYKRNQALISMKNTDTVSLKSDKAVMTLHDMATEWLEQKRKSVKESTYVRYRYLYEKHIDEAFGKETLLNLDRAAIETYIKSKQQTNITDGLAPKTVQDILSVYHILICYGIDKGYLSSGYIFHKTTESKTANSLESSIKVLHPRERIRLEEFVLRDNTVRSLGIIITLYTGIRIGELCALRWKDIDLDNGILYIRNTMQRLKDYSDERNKKTKLIIGPPKTMSSQRMIPLSAFLLEKLEEYVASPDFFFLTGEDKPEEPRSYLYFYKRQLKICGLPEYTFHALRHTFATRCVEEGIDVKSLSEILGHSNIKITMNRYVHPSLETKRQQLEKLYSTL